MVAPPVFAWDDLHALTRRLRSGEEAEKSDELAKAIAQYEYLAREVRGLPMGAAAEAGRRRIASAAREALDAAKSLPPASAAAALDAAAARFRDTPFAADFAAVRDRLRKDGRFPPIE